MKAFDLETETRLRKLMWLSKTGNLEPSVEQTEFFTFSFGAVGFLDMVRIYLSVSYFYFEG